MPNEEGLKLLNFNITSFFLINLGHKMHVLSPVKNKRIKLF